MAFNGFALWLLIRVALLFVTLIGLSIALTSRGYYSITLLLTILTIAQLIELYRHVNKTNIQLKRFLQAARYGDFSQSIELDAGANFEPLAEAFGDIMKRLDATRVQQHEQLRHLKSLTEHIPIPLLSLYPDGLIKLHNNAARQLFSSINVNKIEDLSVFGQGFIEAINNLEPGCRSLVNFVDDGVERQLTMVMSHIITGTISENLISMQDIQSELDSAQLQAWQDLVRVLTHEMMNSITPIASLAKTSTSLVDDVRAKLETNIDVGTVTEDLEDVHRAVSTVSRRSDGLMQFVQSYRSLTLLPTPQKQVLVILDLYQNLEKLFTAQWASKGIVLIIKVEPEGLTLLADADLLEQVLINLLQNAEQALSALDNPNVTPQVTLSARMNQRGFMLLEVADNGPGIPNDIAKEIFIPFFTTKREGSGVGLALTRQIMIAHGGNVTVNPSDTGGARFTLVF